MVTTLAILFIVLLVGAILYGFGIVMRRPPTHDELTREKCSLCLQMFPKEELVERQIGDYRVLYFCERCVMNLQADLEQRRDGQSKRTSVEKHRS
jgi:hypothetical protein